MRYRMLLTVTVLSQLLVYSPISALDAFVIQSDNGTFNQQFESTMRYAQVQDIRSDEIGTFGLEELTELEKNFRDINAKYEDLDSRLINLLSRIKAVGVKQSDGATVINTRINVIEERVRLRVSNAAKVHQQSFENLKSRISLIEDALLKNHDTTEESRIIRLEKKLISVQEAALNQPELSEHLLIKDFDMRLALIEESLNTLLEAFEKSSANSKILDNTGPNPKGAVLVNDVASQTTIPVDFYDSGIIQYEKGNFLGAIQIFKEFIENYPDHNLASNAQYWIGDSYFSIKQYEFAITAQTTLLLTYQDSPKLPDALLVIGSSHKKLGDIDKARQAWQTLMEKFPGSSPANKAGKRISNLP